jgi:hypothetical protein
MIQHSRDTKFLGFEFSSSPLENRGQEMPHVRTYPQPCGDRFAHRVGAVPRRRHLIHATRVKNGDAERLQLLLDRLSKRGIENPSGDVEGRFSH